MSKRPNSKILAAAAAVVIAVVIVGVVWAALDDSADPVATSPSIDDAASTTTEPPSARQVARAYWEAIAASDLDAAVALLDPSVVSHLHVKPAGSASTLAELFDFYDAVGWEWEVEGCRRTETQRNVVECGVVERNAWSEVLGIAPMTTSYRVAVRDGGVNRLSNREERCCPGLPEFYLWVHEMYPDDAAVMWESDPAAVMWESYPDGERVALFELNTARFVDAHSTPTAP
jgi:hypothetical protein